MSVRQRWRDLSGRAIAALDSGAGGWGAFAVAACISAALELWLTRGTTFWFDELTFFAGDHGFDPSYLLTPHNGQLLLGPRFVYAAVFKAFGADYVVFRVIEAVGVVSVAALVHALCRRRIRGAVALAPAVLLLFFGSSSGATFAPLGMVNVYCVVGGLGAFYALERGGRFADPLAALLLAFSLSFWSPGLAFAAGVFVLLLRRPGWLRRVWVVAVPVGLYILWRVTDPGLHGPLFDASLNLKASNVLLIPVFSADSSASIASGITGLDYGFTQTAAALAGPTPDNLWGPLVAAVAWVSLALALRRLRPSTWPWPWMAALLALWTSLALAASGLRTPGTDRYVYVGVVITLVLAADVAGRFKIRDRIAVLVLTAATLALGANIAMLLDASTYQRNYATSVRADFAAIELARPYVDPTFVPTVGAISPPILAAATNAGTYLAAVDRIGSFADTLPELRSSREQVRDDADQILAQADRIGLVPSPPPGDSARCRRATASAAEPLTMPLATGRTVMRFDGHVAASVALRRFGTNYSEPLASLEPGRYFALEIPPDAAPDRWWVQFNPPGAGRVTVCAP